jgi:hypothetical protein
VRGTVADWDFFPCATWMQRGGRERCGKFFSFFMSPCVRGSDGYTGNHMGVNVAFPLAF